MASLLHDASPAKGMIRSPALAPRRGCPQLPPRSRGRRSDRAWPEDASPGDAQDQDAVVYVFSAGGISKLWPKSSLGGSGLSGPPSPSLVEWPLPNPQDQSLCIGATFWVAASNGVDPTRRVNLQGFCQSPDVLSEVVGGAVVERGGEVMLCEKQLKGGVHERLRMAVAVPFLFGVPPELETLKDAIQLGGGFLHRVYGQWFLV